MPTMFPCEVLGFRPGARACSALAVALAACGVTMAQQFVDETASRFPSLSEYTNQVTMGDIDGDGDLDLIFANGQGFGSQGAALPVRVFINNGSAVFTDQSAARTGGLTGWHRGVELGDCDVDGDLDVILTNDFNHLPNLLINGAPASSRTRPPRASRT
jgi:hypothetical protein